MELNGKTALLTGGVGGIGKCIARSLLENGASVVLFDLCKEKGEEFTQQLQTEYGKGRVHFVAGDVTKKEDLERAFKETLEKFSYLDIMLNNAGIGLEEKWEDMININWVALVRGTNEALKVMSKSAGGKGGVIVNTASIAGMMAYMKGPVYAGTKAAVIGFTRSHGGPQEFEKTGVRFAAICPNLTDTDLLGGPTGLGLTEYLKQMQSTGDAKYIPQKPENVATAVIHLIKEAPNGSIWVVEHEEPAYQLQMPHHKEMKMSR
ncbi:15-hydroxyprostaglandin dehydrogenase [NAD(+)]-like [Ischnura elegans]|uniref:15-hydroxyprostaglandin dehydrogenase [NAD(+)]-like n=1 Tax=Ischnura elegans TaxID=197161 RepID=UPI001ED8BE3C|nr:15-hydroxyprostaglandin dehydrogenase [NAD(+)]-like [Ischnura elegans]XP_046397446.1 15-hydroxyprostaglandin dehydrogenase [NAD(+)]-like [Ischnura elegans]XP_046397447.1 15-hydroxyprostaglandin dehydrogenase [NAD(+)]-like [Ischnura elegans]